jgi:hypothetical protein
MHPKKAALVLGLVFLIKGALAIMGLIPSTNTFFGYMPLWGKYVAVHALFAVVAAYFGIALSARAHKRVERPDRLPQNRSTPHARL